MTGFFEGFLTGIGMYTKSPLFYLLIVLLVLRVLYRVKRPAIRGVFGEWRVNRRLAKLGDEYRIFADMYVPDGKDGYTQIDHIVTSPYGIFVIETKHYSGWIFGRERQKNWTQVIYKRKEKMYNPIWQNFGHIQCLKTYLEIEELEMHSIIAFSSDAKLKFKEPFETAHVINVNELKKVINRYVDIVLSETELRDINKSLEQLSFTDKKQKRRVKAAHLKSVKSKQSGQKPDRPHLSKVEFKPNKSASKKIESVVELNPSIHTGPQVGSLGYCPRCTHELVQRNGKFGEFVGCSAFPKCRYTLKKEA
ncbi:NERD domain-containing protein [Sporosarcina gallistercoris]|uniref:NERD domain-containing protein n=1 Tax=Sporosarcina gallistercoris TaxID=2762245 RepID=UPI003D28CB17